MRYLKALDGRVKYSLRGWITVLLFGYTSIGLAATEIITVESMGLSNFDVISEKAPEFGSSEFVTLNWDPDNDPLKKNELLAWNWGYSGRAAAFCFYGAECALELTAVNDSTTVTLDSFFLGFFNYGDFVSYDVVDLETQLSILSGSPWVDGVTGALIEVNASSDAGFRIIFGPDGFNGGINDITYSYHTSDLNPIPTPVPAAFWFLISGLAILGRIGRNANDFE